MKMKLESAKVELIDSDKNTTKKNIRCQKI